MLSSQKDSSDSSTDRVLATAVDGSGLQQDSGETSLAGAINNLVLQISEDRRATESRLDGLENAIAAMSSQYNNFRGRGRGRRGGRGGGRGNYNNNNNNRNTNYSGNYNNSNNNRSGNSGRGRGRGGIRCFNCNGLNHRARDCTAEPEN